MTTTALVLTILASLIKLLLTCMPTDAVNWILKKFELHFKLDDADALLTMEGKSLQGEEKLQVIEAYNEAKFLKEKHIFPGNEQLFLQPEDGGTPLVVDTMQGKREVRLHIFIYNDRVDVVKQYKKKLRAYSLYSDILQNRTVRESA